MPFKVRIQNFQSLKDVTIEVKGFTVVTGRNNSGKSAAQRALRGAFQNARGTSFIQHGTTKASVKIDFEDGTSLLWEKGKDKGDKPTYVINDGEAIHPGQAVPDEVRELGVRPLTVGGKEIWPQIAPQFTGQVFLLDQPGSVLAEAVADVTRVTQLNDALRLAESDRRAAASELKVRLTDRVQLEEEVRQFEGLDTVDLKIQGIVADADKLKKIETARQKLQGVQVKLSQARTAVHGLEGIESIAAQVPSQEGLNQVQQLGDRIQGAQKLAQQWQNTSAVVQALAGVEVIAEQVPAKELLADLQTLSNDIQGMQKLVPRWQMAKTAYDRLANIPTAEALPDLTSILQQLGPLNSLQELQVRRTRMLSLASGLDKELQTATVELTAAEQEVDQMLDSLGQCPLCGAVRDHTDLAI